MNAQKMYLQVMDRFFPSLSAKQVYHVLSNPRIRKLKDFEEEILDKAEQETITFRDFSIQTYTWGNPSDKPAFLIHGWEGHAGNFGGLIDLLLEKGYFIKAFDGPAHGRSSKGKTSMFEFAELVSLLLQRYRPQAIISHSFGSVTTMMALSENTDIPVDQWIVVTTPHNFKDRVSQIQDYIGVTHRTMDKVIGLIEKDTQTSIDQLNIPHYGDRVSHVKKVLIVHSQSDKVLPIRSARIAHESIPQSDLIELNGLGHYSILWSEELKEIVKNALG